MAFNINQNNAKRRRAAISDINITPFVDVLLVLLIIFMVAAPMMTSTIDLQLPQGANSKNNKQEQSVSVSIKGDGSIYIEENLVKLNLLPQELLRATNNNIGGKILVRADVSIDYGKVMDIVKLINQAGFTQIMFVTEVS